MGAITDMFRRKKPDNNQPMYMDQLVGFVDEEYQRRQSERKPFELQWRLNTEFVNGNQYLQIDTVANTIVEIPKMYWYQEREVHNQCATIVETRISRLTRQKPIMKTRPASSDDSDVSSAKISSMLLGSGWHEQSMDEAYNDFVSWLELHGTCFWKVSWNKNKGKAIGMMPQQPILPGNSDDDKTIYEQFGTVFNQSPQIVLREGDIETAVTPCHEIFPDSPWRQGVKQCQSIIHAKAFHIKRIEEMWGIQVDPEEVDVMTLQSARAGLGGLGYNSGSYRGGVTKMRNHAVVKEYWELPTMQYPNGRLIIVCSNKLLYAGPLPYMIGQDGEPEYPFIRVVSIDNPGCFWGKSVIERCIPIQRRYNALRNRKAEYLNLVAIGQWYEPLNSVDDDTELNNAPANRIKYRPGPNGEKPEPVTWPSLPASFENEQQALLSEFTSISGISELSRYSEAPSGVKSGVALSIANEQDDTRIGTTAARIGAGIVNLGIYWLRLYRQFVQEDRLLRWVGANREVDVRFWNASDLRSDDVIIENMSALSETPSQRRQMVFDLINTGIFNRPETNPFTEEGRQKVFQLLEFGHWETGSEDDNFLQKSRARRENYDIMHGMQVQVNDFDDHQMHIEQHNRQRMQAEWEEIIKSPAGQMVDQLMRMHLAQHYQAAMSMMPQKAPQNSGQQPDNSANQGGAAQ